MWELDYKESWMLKNWCFWTVVLEKTLESPLDCKEIKLVHLKDWWTESIKLSPEYSLEGLKLKLKLQYFGHLIWRTDSFDKTLMLGKIEGKGKGTTENEMVGWHHRLNGHEFEQALGDGEGQGSLACCSPRGHKESDMTEWLNNDNKAKQVDKVYLIELDKILQNMSTFLCISKSKPIIKSRKNIFCFPVTWID